MICIIIFICRRLANWPSNLDATTEHPSFIPMIQFHILGAGGAVPTPTHTPAAYWVTVDGHPILMDPGSRRPGAPGQIRSCPPGRGRHRPGFSDPPAPGPLRRPAASFFRPAFAGPRTNRTDPTFRPARTDQLSGQLREIYGSWLEPQKPRARGPGNRPRRHDTPTRRWNHPTFPGGPPPGPPVKIPPRITRFPTPEGHTAVFSGDTGPCAELNKAAAGADLLVVECSTPDHLATSGHMTVSQVGELCVAAQPK